MRKYLNSALIYQWFNSAKTAIILGILIWGFSANSIIRCSYQEVMRDISSLNNNDFATVGLDRYFILGIIFLGIYFIVSGMNKRNITMFLSSGPYTKKQIKYNELFCFLITLGMFVLTYIYIAITFYIRNRERFSIINGYSTILTVEIIRLIVFGMIGILFMLIVDSMFSNNTIGAIFIIIIPISFAVCILQKMDYYIYIWNNKVIQKIPTLEEIQDSRFRALTDWVYVRQFRMKNVVIGACILLIFAGVLFIILKVSQRKNSLETNIRFFASKWSEKIITVYLSVVSGILIKHILFSSFQHNIIWNDREFAKLSIIDFNMILGTDIICSAIFGIIVYIIIKKMLKNFSY